MEQECYSTSASKPVYLSKLAHSSSEAKALSSAAELLAKASTGAATSAQSPDAASPSKQQHRIASRHAQPPSADGTEEESIGRRLHEMCTSIEARVASGGPLDPGAAKGVLEQLSVMRDARVTASLLRETGIGHRVKALSKRPDKVIAAAAKDVIAAWKMTICKASA